MVEIVTGFSTAGTATGEADGAFGTVLPATILGHPIGSMYWRGAAAGLIWSARGSATEGPAVNAIGSDGAGNVLLVDATGNVFKSVDGGHTWNLFSNIAGYTEPSAAELFFGNGIWLLSSGADPGNGNVGFARSIDGGATWTSPIDSQVQSAGSVHIATDGAGTWVCSANVIAGANPNYARSIDDGATWVSSDPFTGGVLSDIFWNGAEFFGVGLDGSSSPIVATSADGTVWTITPSTNQFVVTNQFGSSYVAAGLNAGSTFAASFEAVSPAGLAVAAAVNTGLDPTVGVQEIMNDGTVCFVFDFQGGVANSNNLTTWSVGTLNLPGGDFVVPGCCTYDSVNQSFIAGGATGNVVTYP